MQQRITPSILARNQEELDRRVEKVRPDSSIVHLDVADGVFVDNMSLTFDLKAPSQLNAEAHLMVQKPAEWEHIIQQVQTVVFHTESSVTHESFIEDMVQRNKQVGVAVNPETSVSHILPYLGRIHLLLILTVHPGQYGASFVPETLKKVQAARQLDADVTIAVDGHMTPETIKKAARHGAQRFIVGSYLQNSADPTRAMETLRGALPRR